MAGKSTNGTALWVIGYSPLDRTINTYGALMQRQDPQPSIWSTIEMASVSEALFRIDAARGRVIQTKTTIPRIGYRAYCQDTEGNVFGVHQEDPSAQESPSTDH